MVPISYQICAKFVQSSYDLCTCERDTNYPLKLSGFDPLQLLSPSCTWSSTLPPPPPHCPDPPPPPTQCLMLLGRDTLPGGHGNTDQKRLHVGHS